MSIERLRTALVNMPATGEHGFEGLAATLLSALTGDRFYVARSGEQAADAVSAASDIAIQGKRYDKTTFNETEFEGDFSKACRLCSKLDCYVLAATRPVAQLRALAQELELRTGVDVLLLEFAGFDSELPALCVTFWGQIAQFPKLSELSSDFAAWAAGEAKRPQVIGTIERLRNTLRDSVPLAATVERKIKRYLNGRFGIDPSAARPSRYPITLPKAVRRQRPHQAFENWWKHAKTRAAACQGEEGMGKSWVAAAFATELVTHSQGLVLWLDSADWSGLLTVDAVIDAGLMQVGFADQELRARLARKATTRWSDRLLIILDGVNERTARETANRLLSQLYAAEVPLCRVVFTTRPINWKSDERCLWNAATLIAIESFTEEELRDALTRLPTAVLREELVPSLVEVAKIPRYFQRAVELRERFKSLSNVSKEMVLWADLLAKVEAGDPQITHTIGWSSVADVRRALMKLALGARALKTDGQNATDSYSLLQSCFGDKFERIRSDLAEQRVVLEPSGDNPTPSAEHLILGFALHLGSICMKYSSDPLIYLVDRVRQELEPVLSQDQLTEGLFVALQLSAFSNSEGHTLSSHARSALLFAWTSSQNSRVDEERLRFWATEDLSAYVEFIEEVFVDPVSDSWSELIINPLKNIWLASPSGQIVLDPRLRRWLKFVWKSHDLPDTAELKHEGHCIPIARSRAQLALSHAALAVLSERPIDSFLNDLAIASATNGVSTQRYSMPQQPDGRITEVQEIHCKDIHYNLGAVLRWCYTEEIKPKLELLRSKASDEVVHKGLGYIIDEFDRFGWRRGSAPEKHLASGLPLFTGTDERDVDCPELAIRDDFPELSANDQAIIANKIERVFSSGGLHSGYSRTLEDLETEFYLSWFSKYRPARLAELGAHFRLAALDFRVTGPALHFANQLPYSLEIVSPAELLRKAKECASREHEHSDRRILWSLLQLHSLAFTCFSEAELKEWLIFASERKLPRREIHFYPIPILCPLCVSNALANFARGRAKECSNEAPEHGPHSYGKFDFWAYVGGLAGEADSAYHAWVDDQIRNRPSTGDRRFHWRLLWFRSAPQQALENAITDGSILEFFAGDGLWTMGSANRYINNWKKLTVSFDDLVRVLPLDDVGTVLLNARRHADLTKWGHLVFNKALTAVGHPPFDRRFWGTTIYLTDASGTIQGATCDREAGRENRAVEPLHPHECDLFAPLRKQESTEEWERQANEAIQIWHQDQERLRSVDEGALSEFDAASALAAWRDHHPDFFRKYGLEMLSRAATDPDKAFHIGAFVAHTIDALIPLDPDAAVKLDRAIRKSSIRVNLVNDYGVPTFVAAFWRNAANGIQLCKKVCRDLIEGSLTDEELMFHAIAAQAEGAQDILLSICAECFNDLLAKNRCLAVSLLAWVPEKAQIFQLEHLAADDLSGWVRTHAEWASEVAKQELAVRRHYQRTLKASDRNAVLAHLQVLLPALTPSALWWHRELERDDAVFNSAPALTKSTIAFFWHDVGSKCKETPKLFGRKLSEYLRGERIYDLRTPKPRLLSADALSGHIEIR